MKVLTGNHRYAAGCTVCIKLVYERHLGNSSYHGCGLRTAAGLETIRSDLKMVFIQLATRQTNLMYHFPQGNDRIAIIVDET
jgi:hypothetical protein